MKQELSHSLRIWLLLTLITGVAYPFLVWIGGHGAWVWQCEGSPVLGPQGVVGSARVGQYFQDPGYFHGRPSATADHPYNALASGGSNWGPAHPDLRAVIQKMDHRTPSMLTMASGSGLDPHLSPEALYCQINRVASVHGLDSMTLHELIAMNVEGKLWGVFGEARVNVLSLNQQLDRLATRRLR
jgi:potassium-transporting ATPase KdpC subunit